MAKSDIVFGSEFSPKLRNGVGRIVFPKILELVEQHAPSRKALEDAVRIEFFADRRVGAGLEDNTVLSLSNYRIIHMPKGADTYEITPFCRTLLAARGDEGSLRDLMGKHLLANLGGMRLIEAIRMLIAANQELTGENVATALTKQGLHVSNNGKHINMLRIWLEYCDILNASHGGKQSSDYWKPNETRVAQLIGITADDAEAWSELDSAQYDFARAFASMGVDKIAASKVREMAESLYGTKFVQGGLPQSVLHELERVGLLKWTKVTGGQGSKSHVVEATPKLKNEFLAPILEQLVHGMGRGYRRLATMPLARILADMGSQDKNTKGIALEALAFYLCRRLDLEFRKWRYKNRGYEVDLFFESKRLVFSRWQVQCKNTPTVETEDLAKEVGIAVTRRSQVILLATNGRIGNGVAKFARDVMETTALHVILLSGDHLRQIVADASRLRDILNEQAAEAMVTKRQQLED